MKVMFELVNPKGESSSGSESLAEGGVDVPSLPIRLRFLRRAPSPGPALPQHKAQSSSKRKSS